MPEPGDRSVQVVAGLVSGVVQAALLNPLDRALFVALIEQRGVMHVANWAAPYQGVLQAISQRTLSGSLYYVLQDSLRPYCTPVSGACHVCDGCCDVVDGDMRCIHAEDCTLECSHRIS